jgi:hypothetical protein
MAKKKNIGTMISVPADLKRRMGKVKEGVNWSAVACRAFEKRLDRLAVLSSGLACEQCLYFKGNSRSRIMGQCWRYPPTREYDGPRVPIGYYQDRPAVRCDEYCGEFHPLVNDK